MFCGDVFASFFFAITVERSKLCMSDLYNISVITVFYEYRVRNLKFARNLKFPTSKTLVNFMKKMMFLSKNWYFSVQKALIYYTFNKSHHNSFILLVFSHVANFRYVANFRFLTLLIPCVYIICFFFNTALKNMKNQPTSC